MSWRQLMQKYPMPLLVGFFFLGYGLAVRAQPASHGEVAEDAAGAIFTDKKDASPATLYAKRIAILSHNLVRERERVNARSDLTDFDRLGDQIDGEYANLNTDREFLDYLKDKTFREDLAKQARGYLENRLRTYEPKKDLGSVSSDAAAIVAHGMESLEKKFLRSTPR